ncbi:nuclear transport factor 2 family protein [Candidatus Nitrosocosmicus agrestis]|jgi:hypothetical protein|uniref:nuclear transport factor 2 family protein n=1 Tax=Candidatus Nitrosocosmicus agrestis TaxID=2563600 RepID=UPI00122E2DFC|nr:nuclear transport factor 2 family protein [Candidatus Nitrosocosmicus sp. SS]KAA2283138.1 nuclear transport factor 2 family protein [Candidatus Nitrosocosmicus sp. SS]KAF0868594.1 nuclear transport factor 2 family protein [Candidatus Nitrosocosmicus sp. SS]
MEKSGAFIESSKDIVMEYFQATDNQDWQLARGSLSDNFSYLSPVNSFDNPESYLKYFKRQYQLRGLTKLDIKKVFPDGNDVCILQEYNSQIMCFWIKVDDKGKINSIRAILDPRPFMQQK